jgi:hypothetical protein
VVNKAEGLSDNEIWTFVVRRADGRYEMYRLPINEVPRDSNERYQAFYESLLQLGPDDEIFQQGPPNYGSRNPANPTEQDPSSTPFPLFDVQERVTPAAQGQTITQPTHTLYLPFAGSHSPDE